MEDIRINQLQGIRDTLGTERLRDQVQQMRDITSARSEFDRMFQSDVLCSITRGQVDCVCLDTGGHISSVNGRRVANEEPPEPDSVIFTDYTLTTEQLRQEARRYAEKCIDYLRRHSEGRGDILCSCGHSKSTE